MFDVISPSKSLNELFIVSDDQQLEVLLLSSVLDDPESAEWKEIKNAFTFRNWRWTFTSEQLIHLEPL